MTIKFYLKDPSKKESLIIAQVLWQQNQLRYTTKKVIESIFWIAKNESGERIQRVKQTSKYPIYPEINQALNNIQNDIKKIFIRYENENQGSEPTPEILKQLLDTHLNRVKNKIKEIKPLSFVEYVEEFVKKSEKGIRNNHKSGKALSISTLKTYRTTLQHLQEYQALIIKEIGWIDINLDFHAEYSDFLMHELELANNTVGKDFQIIKLVCSEAFDAGINKYEFFRSKRFVVLREASFAIFFNESEIKLLWNLDLSSNVRYEITRDLFVLACQTGLRYSDYSKIKEDQIFKNSIQVKQVKTGKHIEIPLHDLSLAVVKKYNNKLPHSMYNQDFNEDIKAICKLIPAFHRKIESEISKGGLRVLKNQCQYEMAMSHTPRRSFATNEVMRQTSISVIMAITGHTSEKSFWKYVKLEKNDYTKMWATSLETRNNLQAVS